MIEFDITTEARRGIRNAKLTGIANKVTDMISEYGRRQDIIVRYRAIDSEFLSTLSDWDRRRFGMHDGDEAFLVYESDGYLLYVVNVSGDSLLTAAWELMDLVSRKF